VHLIKKICTFTLICTRWKAVAGATSRLRHWSFWPWHNAEISYLWWTPWV